MLNIIDALSRGYESSFMYPKVITTLSYITSWNEKNSMLKGLVRFHSQGIVQIYT
jgi:hypothetical protein